MVSCQKGIPKQWIPLEIRNRSTAFRTRTLMWLYGDSANFTAQFSKLLNLNSSKYVLLSCYPSSSLYLAPSFPSTGLVFLSHLHLLKSYQYLHFAGPSLLPHFLCSSLKKKQWLLKHVTFGSGKLLLASCRILPSISFGRMLLLDKTAKAFPCSVSPLGPAWPHWRSIRTRPPSHMGWIGAWTRTGWQA